MFSRSTETGDGENEMSTETKLQTIANALNGPDRDYAINYYEHCIELADASGLGVDYDWCDAHNDGNEIRFDDPAGFALVLSGGEWTPAEIDA